MDNPTQGCRRATGVPQEGEHSVEHNSMKTKNRLLWPSKTAGTDEILSNETLYIRTTLLQATGEPWKRGLQHRVGPILFSL